MIDFLSYISYIIFSDQIAETWEACDRGRVPRPLSFFIWNILQRGTYEQTVYYIYRTDWKTEKWKNLVITDDDFAVESLQNISYYALIGGYKHPFIDIHTRKYINEACFEDIVALYEFDEELRGIFFKYLCRVERKMRSSIS